ncbi:radical SAM protein [Altericista sp. CCNU0014]|uniref:radical SAM protein n=1 Tax=Altericista sp. CCNU0014 TaxID=3082949 RepID=UPI00384EEE16
MGLVDSKLALVRYKLRHVGLRNAFRVASLDLSESVLYQLSKRLPNRSFSPRSIQIECTTRCNLKCTFCEISYWSEQPADLQLGNIEQMLERLPRVRRVDLTGIGEALMNPEFFNIIRVLKSRGIYVTLNDNFTLVTEATARRLVEAEVDQIFLSLDGAAKKTYESLRRGATFERVIANAKRLIEIKREMGRKLPEVKINTVVCLENYQELTALVELACDIGVGMIQFVNAIAFEDTRHLEVAPDLVRQSFDRALARARELGLLVKVELFEKRPVRQCDFPWTRNFVTQDGYVHPCCYTTQSGDRAAQNQRSLGNLLDRSFAEIWQGPDYSTFRQKMAQGILPFQCAHCPKYFGKPDRPSAQLHP